MPDLDPRASRIGELHFSRFGIEARQLVFDSLQRFEHLDCKKMLGPLLNLGTGQNALPFHHSAHVCLFSLCITVESWPSIIMQQSTPTAL